MFGILTKKARQNDRDDDVSNGVSQVCLDPDYLAERLSSMLSEKINGTSGHIHFHFRNKSDHIITIWSEGKLRKIAAKSPGCEKGRYAHWRDSEFCNYNREDILRELHNDIERVEIDMDGFNKTWPSYAEFMEWLDKN